MDLIPRHSLAVLAESGSGPIRSYLDPIWPAIPTNFLCASSIRLSFALGDDHLGFFATCASVPDRLA